MFYIGTWLWATFCCVCSWVGFVSVTSYLVMVVAQQVAMRFPQSLKKRYGAEWGLVTGASSGIGRAIVEKLAEDGVNVVLVALDDPTLNSTFAQIQQKYPHCSFRKVGVNLGADGMRYMVPIIEATKDIDVSLVFNNAGYVQTGLIDDTELEHLRTNLECNAGCSIPITHHFVRAMLERGRRGLVTFTSSVCTYFPSPTATMYSPSKAFLTNFATTVAAELKGSGIDVVVIHPSPVNTNFFTHPGPSLGSLALVRKTAGTPRNVADQIFASAGRLTVWDQGYMCVVFRLVHKIVDFQVYCEIFARCCRYNGDQRKIAAAAKSRARKIA